MLLKHLKSVFLRTLIAFIFILVLLMAPWAAFANLPPEYLAPISDDTAATRALGLVNEWRISEGLVPLRLNPILQQMAQAQAEFVLPKYKNIENEEDYHRDAKGRTPIKRAIEIYKWPNYAGPERVEVGENAAQSSIKGAVEFWKESPIHHKTATNPTYREVGIVAIPLSVKGTFLFYMDFGARPGNFTVMYSPDDDSVYLSRETSKYSKEKSAKPTIRFYNDKRAPLTEKLPYATQMKVPAGAGDTFFVVYILAEDNETWVQIDRKRDQIIRPNRPITVQDQVNAVANALAVVPMVISATTAAATTIAPTVAPTNLPTQATTISVAATGLPTQPPTLSATPAPSQTLPPTPTNRPAPTATHTPKPTNTKTRAGAPSTNTPRPLSTQAGKPTNTPQVNPTSSPTSNAASGATFTLYYDNRSLYIHNSAKRPLKLDGLQVGQFPISIWENDIPLPMDGLAVDNCLGVVVQGTGSPSTPRVCKIIWVQINVSASQAFWAKAPFDITLNGTVIQTCAPDAAPCVVKLP